MDDLCAIFKAKNKLKEFKKRISINFLNKFLCFLLSAFLGYLGPFLAIWICEKLKEIIEENDNNEEEDITFIFPGFKFGDNSPGPKVPIPKGPKELE